MHWQRIGKQALVCRFGDNPKQAQDNSRRELKRIVNDAALRA